MSQFLIRAFRLYTGCDRKPFLHSLIQKLDPDIGNRMSLPQILIIGALFAAAITCVLILYARSETYFWMFSVIRVLGVISGLLGVWISVLMVGGRKGSSGSLSKLPGTSGKHTKSRAFVNVLSVLMALGMMVATVFLFW